MLLFEPKPRSFLKPYQVVVFEFTMFKTVTVHPTRSCFLVCRHVILMMRDSGGQEVKSRMDWSNYVSYIDWKKEFLPTNNVKKCLLS